MLKEYMYFAVILIAFSYGCATVATEPRPASYYDKAYLAQEAVEPESLFSSDSTILSDEDIKRILAFHYKPQKQNRVGILTFDLANPERTEKRVGKEEWQGRKGRQYHKMLGSRNTSRNVAVMRLTQF